MNKKVEKALFITNDASNYGASKSLQLLLKNYEKVSIDLIVAKRIIGGVSMRKLRERFGTRVKTIMKFHLPIDYCYRGKPEPPWLLWGYKLLLKGLWNLNKRKFRAALERGKYDFIHLNSLVLHELITCDHPFLIHIREIFDQSSDHAIESIQKAKGVIFISRAARDPFQKVPLLQSIVLNNPIDMTPPQGLSSVDPGKHRIAFQNNTMFSMVGKISKDKGVDFVIQCFMEQKNDNARLLIVGKAPGNYSALRRCKRLAKRDKRIFFWGEETDIWKIYYMSDYVLRGEPYPCVGRTIYEGLYAGCEVIIPATKETLAAIFEYDKFAEKIHSYAPRDAGELTDLLETLAKRKIRNRRYRSNIPGYVKKFREFAEKVKER